jgi:hypothetical protein
VCGYKKRGMSRRLGIDQMHAIAKEHGGKCLSTEYVGKGMHLQWECSEGHRWKTTAGHIKSGTWCKICRDENSAQKKRLGISKMQELAKERYGKCLSTKYVNSNTKLEWECANGHRWKSTPNNVITFSWCQECSSGISERICRAYFRQIFGKPFPKSRPKWLKNRYGNQMELDGYCKDLRIAFEHQGEQHYTTNTHFVVTQEHLNRRLKDDKDKSDLCKKNGIRLFAVPALFDRTKLEDLQKFIYDECKRLKVRRPAGMLDKKINLKSAWLSDGSKKILQEMHALAKEHGGKCLSKMYINMRTKLEWECSEGHRWKAVPYSVKGFGTWCNVCSSRSSGIKRSLSLDEMHALAKEHGGKCLSTEYKDTSTHLEWECAKGHRWKAVPRSIKYNKTWCRKCSWETRRQKSN